MSLKGHFRDTFCKRRSLDTKFAVRKGFELCPSRDAPNQNIVLLFSCMGLVFSRPISTAIQFSGFKLCPSRDTPSETLFSYFNARVRPTKQLYITKAKRTRDHGSSAESDLKNARQSKTSRKVCL